MKTSSKTLVVTNVVIAIIALSMLVAIGNGTGSSPAPLASAGSTAPTVATGLARNFGLSGPTLVEPTFPAAGTMAAPTAVPPAGTATRYSVTNLAADHSRSAGAATAPDPPIPTVSCVPASAACDAIASAPPTVTTNPFAMNATLNDKLYPTIGDVEPPDQGMCASNRYVMEAINIGEVQIFSANTLLPVSGALPLDSLMGLTARGWSSGGDVFCLHDVNNGGHWFVIEFASTTPEKIGGTFAGCFAALRDSCREAIAVSATNNPMGAYYVYFLDPNKVNNDPGKGFLLNDYAKAGTTRDAFMLFYDEFNLNGNLIPPCPAFGCGGFNGAQELVFDKNALEMGQPVSSPALTAAYENLGRVATPDGGCGLVASNPYTCWYQVIPAGSPDPTQFDNSHGGSGFMVGSLDFFSVGDNRIAVFDWTDLSALNSASCSTCAGIGFGITLFTGLETYLDEGAGCPVSDASFAPFCGLAAQKAGPVPLGVNCVAFGLVPLTGGLTTCPENGIATNGDGATQATYADGEIWMAVSTIVRQNFSGTTEFHVGAAFWSFGTAAFNAGGRLTLDSQGYVTAMHQDMEFPVIAAGDLGGAVISFSLSGTGYYPSTAFGRLATGATGAMGHTIYVAAMGQSPQDGFTEYLSLGTNFFRPRWGDYGQAVYVSGLGFFFAGEYIQHPNCSPSAFVTDPTCGGTRDPFANFGTAISLIP
jgi:hypothetical protein